MWLSDQVGKQVVVQFRDKQYVMVQPPGIPVTFDDGTGPAVATTPALPGKLVSVEEGILVVEYRDQSWPRGVSMKVFLREEDILAATVLEESLIST